MCLGEKSSLGLNELLCQMEHLHHDLKWTPYFLHLKCPLKHNVWDSSHIGHVIQWPTEHLHALGAYHTTPTRNVIWKGLHLFSAVTAQFSARNMKPIICDNSRTIKGDLCVCVCVILISSACYHSCEVNHYSDMCSDVAQLGRSVCHSWVLLG